MSDVIVIGAGIAGLTAAIRLAQGGKSVTLIHKGTGGLPLSQGTVDILGYNPDRVERPLEAVGSVPGEHPYAKLGPDAVRDAVAYFAELIGSDLLTGNAEENVVLPTAVGALRPTALAQPSMLAGAAKGGNRYAVVGLQRLKDFQASLIAENLNRSTAPDGGELSARALWVDVVGRAPEVDSTGLVFAKAFDTEKLRTEFVTALKPQLDEGEIVCLPAILGLDDPNAWKDVSERLGHPVCEIPLPPPSIPGMRLNRRLLKLAGEVGVRLVGGSKVLDHVADGSRLGSVSIRTAGRPTEYKAGTFVLCPGGFESGALAMDSYGAVTETVLGLPLVGTNVEDLVTGDYWADQPLFKVGVGVNEQMRVVGRDEAPVYDNVFAAGGILSGAIRWTEKSGEGIALASAVRAADTILGEA